MRRRDFLSLLGGASAAAWPRAANAQSSVMPLIGFVSSRGAGDSTYILTSFHEGLVEYGWVDGKNVSIEYRWAEGRYDRLPGLIGELIARKPSTLVAVGGEPSALAAKAATTSIPIVFTTGGDPVAIGLVASLNRPGGNATGNSLLTSAAESKRFGLLHVLAPGTGAIGALINPSYQAAATQTEELQAAAHAVGRKLVIAHAGRTRRGLRDAGA